MNLGIKMNMKIITGQKITRKKYPLYIYFINFKALHFVYPLILLDFLYNILFPYYLL